MVTLNHFTIPIWLAEKGGWLAPDAPQLFARFCGKVVTELGGLVDWYCTLNEPGVVAYGGYMGAFSFPPGTRDLDSWDTSIENQVKAHLLGRATIKALRPEAKVSMTHALSEVESNWAASPMAKVMGRRMAGAFFEASVDDEFIGVQTYTRFITKIPWYQFPMALLVANSRPVARRVLPKVLDPDASKKKPRPPKDNGRRLTQIGWEYRPQAIAATVRQVASVFPGKDIIITENGIATADDAERVEFIREALDHLYSVIQDGIPLRGYIHWSAFDNFEWAEGYRMQFGLIGVDRSTQERIVKPSARLLGEIARTNRLPN